MSAVFSSPLRLRPLLAAVALGLGAATSALAQDAGTYTGVTSQGQFVQLVISASPTGGRPLLSFVQVVFDVSCETSGTTFLDGYAVSTDIRLGPTGDFARNLASARFYGSMGASYNGIDTFNGTTSLWGARLLSQLPPKAEGCTAVNVSFSATRDASATLLPLTLQTVHRLTQGQWGADGSLRQSQTDVRTR